MTQGRHCIPEGTTVSVIGARLGQRGACAAHKGACAAHKGASIDKRIAREAQGIPVCQRGALKAHKDREIQAPQCLRNGGRPGRGWDRLPPSSPLDPPLTMLTSKPMISQRLPFKSSAWFHWSSLLGVYPHGVPLVLRMTSYCVVPTMSSVCGH